MPDLHDTVKKRGWIWPAFAAAVVIFGAAYYGLRGPKNTELEVVPATKPGTPAVNATTPAATGMTGKAESIDVLVERLSARLQREPNDVDGWVLLGRSYHFLQRWDDATAAFKKARDLGWKGEAPALNADAATSNGSTVANVAANDPIFQGVQAAVQQQAEVLRNPEPESVAATNTAGITVVVSVDAATAKKFSADTAVFIFARPASGPRMPLAVVRKTLGELPATVELGDGQAMMPGQNLSNAPQVIVGARIAASGSPTAQPGDVEALSNAIAPQGQRVELNLLAH